MMETQVRHKSISILIITKTIGSAIISAHKFLELIASVRSEYLDAKSRRSIILSHTQSMEREEDQE